MITIATPTGGVISGQGTPRFSIVSGYRVHTFLSAEPRPRAPERLALNPQRGQIAGQRSREAVDEGKHVGVIGYERSRQSWSACNPTSS
jgi:hypothetical protein